MARFHESRTAAAPARTGALRHARTNEQRKTSHKVILEEMTEKKKKLHTTLSFQSQAPPGYNFVAAGDPRLTAKCKEIARARGLTVYIVSVSSVGRIGYHFPSNVVEQSCKLLGVMFASSGNAHYGLPPRPQPATHRKRKLPNVPARRNQKAKLRAASVGSEIDQKELNAKAASTIRDLFPKIPEKDIQEIIEESFQKGKSKVGTAADQPFVKRVNLAVGAHIRHSHTPYDKLLKQHDYLRARAIVQPITLDKIIEWRDEKDDPDAMEDILREVIVISDDEDEQYSDDTFTDREDSVEVISDQDITNTVHVQPLDYSTLDTDPRHRRSSSLEDEIAPSVKFLRRLSPSPPSTTMRRQQRSGRHQEQRLRIYQEALNHRRYGDHATGEMLSRPVSQRAGVEGHRSHPQDYHEPMHLRSTQAVDKPSSTRVSGNGFPSDLNQPVNFQYNVDMEGRAMRNPQYLPLRPNYLPASTTSSNGTAAFHRRPEHAMQSVDKRTDPDRIVHHPIGGFARPTQSARSAYEEAERVIPSVEIDRFPARPYDGRPSDLHTRLRDRSISPRVVELPDDTIPHAAKRHRMFDADDFNTEVKYAPLNYRQYLDAGPTSPKRLQEGEDGHSNTGVRRFAARTASGYIPGRSRHTEWLPVPGRVDYPPKDGPAGRFSERHVDGPVDQTRTRPPSFVPSAHGSQSVARPLVVDSPPRSSVPMAQEPRSERVVSNRQLGLGRHESALPVRVQEAGPFPQYSRDHALDAVPRKSIQTTYLDDWQVPVRTVPLYTEAENPRYEDRRHHLPRPYEIRRGLQSPRGEVQNHEQPPVDQRQVYHDRAVEHQPSLRTATHLDPRNQTAHYYPQETYRQLPDSQVSRLPVTRNNAGVIYISSSPPAEAR
ncbi:MAG: hypothetical protein Q9174_001280 [Haloplaca sp. 1 TL-2023]